MNALTNGATGPADNSIRINPAVAASIAVQMPGDFTLTPPPADSVLNDVEIIHRAQEVIGGSLRHISAVSGVNVSLLSQAQNGVKPLTERSIALLHTAIASALPPVNDPDQASTAPAEPAPPEDPPAACGANATAEGEPALEVQTDTDRTDRMAEAARFLLALDEEADIFCFQTFDDLESRKTERLTQKKHGTLEDMWAWLDTMNRAGAGVFVTINETDGRGRKEGNITRVRAVFADFDPPKTAAAPAQYPLPPMVEVESSPGKRHAYWMVDDLPLEAFQPMQKAIIAALGSDKAPCDLPRVMRLPGFFHMKDPATPHPVRLVNVDARLPYTADELTRVFRPVAAGTPGTPAPSDGRCQDDYLAELLSGANVHDAALKIVGRMVREGVTNAVIKATFSVLTEKVAEVRGADRAQALMGDELKRMIQGARAKGYDTANQDGTAAPTDRTGSDDPTKLTEQEAEQLIAWAWRTGAALPAAPEQFESEQRDRKGKPFERLRILIAADPNYSAPWVRVAWEKGAKDFLAGVDAYLVGREKRVAADPNGKPDIPSAVLRVDAEQWALRVRQIDVSDEAARELLARITPPWPEPEPLRAPLPAAESYPVESLGPWLAPAVKALHETVKAPIALCAQSVLAAASFAAQAHFDAAMPWGEVKPLSLAMLTIGESGERKSGVDDLVLGAAKLQERQEMEAYESATENYEAELAAWKAANEQAKKKASAKDKGRFEDFRRAAEEVGPPPLAPVLPLRFASDPTVEGLYKLLAVGQPSVALFSDEGGLLIGGHALNSDNALKTLTRWSKLWDGSPYDRVRGGDGSGILYGRRMALHQLAQPEVMTTLLSDGIANGQGFLARCLVAWPASTIGTRHVERYEWGGDRPEIKRLFGRLKGLFETTPRAKDPRGQVLDPTPLKLTRDAEGMAIAANNQFETLMAPNGPLCEIRDRASKAMDNAIRIAGTLAVMDHGTAAKVIEAEHLQRGLELIQWYLAEALRIRGAAAIPQAVSDAELLLAWLKKRELHLFRSAHVLTSGPAPLRNKPRFMAAVEELVKNGYAVENAPGTLVEGIKTRLSWLVNADVF